MDLTVMKFGLTNVFVLENNNNELVIVDTSYEKYWKRFKKQFLKAGFDFARVKYVVLTHCHQDHVGYLYRLLRGTDAKIILHREAVDRLAKGRNLHTHGAPTVMLQLASQITTGKEAVFTPIFDEGRYLIFDEGGPQYLKDSGFRAELVCLPGHTADSLGVLVAGDTLLCGDAVSNVPLSKNHFPLVLENAEELRRSWDYILQHAKLVLPSHGGALDVQTLDQHRRKLNKVKVRPIYRD